MPSGMSPGSRATQFKSGAEWNGNPEGGPKGPYWKQHLALFRSENDDGTFKYTVDEIRQIANSADDDSEVSPEKRLAAISYIECFDAGRDGREARNAMLDRTEGKPHQSMTLDGSLNRDPAREFTQDSLRLIREATDN